MDDENEIYNQPLASFTFGKESLNNSLKKENPKQKISNNLLNKNNTKLNSLNKKGTIIRQNINTESINNNYFENNSAQNYNIITGELYELTFGRNNNINNLTTNPNNDINNHSNALRNNNINKTSQKNIYSTLIYPGGMNDSFIYAVIYSIHHMKLFNKYITNDLNQQILNKKSNLLLLSNLYEILIQMDKNKYINISNFRDNLSNLFQTHRKFLPGQPDDPSELLFVLINSIHSFSINYPLNEISDENCVEKCFSHKFIWLDLSRIDKCKCSGSSKRLFSNHNYITDIPMNKIFNLMRIKNKKENYSLYEHNKKLFEYYTTIVSRMNTNCPVNGHRCPINKTFHKLHLSNSPSYLIFNLEQDFNEYNLNYSFSSLNLLKNFVLIPNNFDIWDLFELNSKKNKNDFDFIGCILFKISKVYSCAFKNNKGLIVYYDCNDIQNENMNNNYNNIMEFVSYFDFVVFCIKNGLIPVMLFYQGSFLTKKEKNKNNNINTFEECLDKEQIDILEKYCINTDNLYNNLQNTLRKKENLIITKKSKNIDDINKNNNIQEFKNNIIINEYTCPNCNYKNKINDKICIQCSNNNNEYLSKKIIIKNIPKNLTMKKESQSLNNSQILKMKIKPLRLLNNKFLKSQDNLKINSDNKITSIINKRKKVSVSPDIKLRDTDKIIEKYNFETNPKRKEKFLMDIPQPVFISKRNTKAQKYFLNKTEINDDNDNNKKMNLDKINIIKMIHKSPKVQKRRIIYNNKNNFPKHKKVLSSNEKFDFLKISKSNDNNIYKNKNSKLYGISRTITINKKLKNLRNIDTEINEQNKNKRKNINLKYEYDRMNNKLIKNNKNTPIYTMHYSYNDIYLEQKVKRKNTNKLKNNKN